MGRTLPTGPGRSIPGRGDRGSVACGMAFDTVLAGRVAEVLGDAPDVTAKRMFGGIVFLVAGNMACGVMGEDLLVRVGKEGAAACLALPFARPMEMGGRVMGGFVVVGADGLDEDEALAGWVERGSAFAASLPPK